MRRLLTVVFLFAVSYVSQLPFRSTPTVAASIPIALRQPSIPQEDIQQTAYRRGNLHIVFSDKQKSMKVYNYRGILLLECAASNEAINPGYGHHGKCPPGQYRIGQIVRVGTPAFGEFFIPIRDITPDGPLHKYKRIGIGIHSGGSSLRNPFAPYQPLLRTHGCIRLHNIDLPKLVRLIHNARASGRITYITIR